MIEWARASGAEGGLEHVLRVEKGLVALGWGM
jgi:hypothetical protein